MRIQNTINIHRNIISHKAEKKQQTDYKEIAQKRAYIEAKTSIWEELSAISFLGAMMAGVYDINTVIKEQKNSKLSVGLIAASAIFLAVKWIKQIQLSKQYNKEIEKDL